MIVVFLGSPGSGKGTQADILAEKHGFFHFDTGSTLRTEIASGSDLGKRISSYTDKGNLVPIEIISELIKSFLKGVDAKRIMFDGFPRNLEQAKVLDEGLESLGDDLDFAVYLEIDEDSLVQRIVNRRFCPECGDIYNLKFHPPKNEGVCDKDGAALTQRKDDTEEVFTNRLKVYLEQTVPVLDYYRDAGKLVTVDGDDEIAQIASGIRKVLGV